MFQINVNTKPNSPLGIIAHTVGNVINHMAAPPQQMMDDTRARMIFAPVEGTVPGVSRLLYHAYASKDVQCMHQCRGFLVPCSCACLPQVSEQLKKGRYVQVYDNRVEINEPDSWMVGCCTCVVRDRVSVIHFDRHVVQNAAKATNCGPRCSHGDCQPSCYTMYGDALVLYSNRPPCCSWWLNACAVVNTTSAPHMSNSGCLAACDLGDLPGCCCFPFHKLVYGLDNVELLAERINTARQLRGAPQSVPPF